MRLLPALLVVLCLAAGLEAGPARTEDDGGFSCPADGLYPNPADCTTFFHCSDGEADLKDCPSGFDFDASTERCEWPDQAGCRKSH